MDKATLNRLKVNPACAKCIEAHMKKYADFVDDDGAIYRDFSVPCMGIPNDFVPEYLKNILSEEQQQEAREIYDPVEWAANWIKLPDGTPWIARWYQETMLRCTARRRVTRCGRRIGKTDVISVHILHYCMTNKNKRVLVVAPYKSQTEEIISRIRDFISTNPKLIASVERDVSSPFYEITFKNGSRIRGFSSGTKSNAEGVSIRGQDADRIYLDEADYLTDGDLKSIVAIVATHQSVELWASSTPTGRRFHFWRWCVKAPTYKEFYFPSMVLPHWPIIEDEVRADYVGKKDDWEHEILANFGEEGVGVFQHLHVDAAVMEYKYEEQKYNPAATYSIGIDWNSEVGTEICVVEYHMGHFRVVDTLNIPKQGWTQLAGLSAVVQMNAKWRPKFIYADEGAGATNIELLRKHGYDVAARNLADPASALKDIVKAYNFSAKIDARDPMTKQPIKKHAKPFMVENAVRFFEEQKIQISAWDQVLRNQLGNYIIKHISVGGVPVYGQTDEKIGDHRLDALMLALVGFKLEMSDFGKPVYDSSIDISLGFSRFEHERFDPKQELQKRLEKMPEERAQDTQSRSSSNMPGMVSKNNVPEYRHGFMTDEEEKYQLRYRLRRLRRQSRLFGDKPKRSNF